MTIPQKPAAAYEAEAVLAERRIDATWPCAFRGSTEAYLLGPEHLAVCPEHHTPKTS